MNRQLITYKSLLPVQRNPASSEFNMFQQNKHGFFTLYHMVFRRKTGYVSFI